jgi:hypothetical protein
VVPRLFQINIKINISILFLFLFLGLLPLTGCLGAVTFSGKKLLPLVGIGGVEFHTPLCRYKLFFLLPLYGQALKFKRVTDKSSGSAMQRHKRVELSGNWLYCSIK